MKSHLILLPPALVVCVNFPITVTKCLKKSINTIKYKINKLKYELTMRRGASWFKVSEV